MFYWWHLILETQSLCLDNFCGKDVTKSELERHWDILPTRNKYYKHISKSQCELFAWQMSQYTMTFSYADSEGWKIV